MKYLEGLGEDSLTEAIAKLVAARVLPVMANIKELSKLKTSDIEEE